MMRAVPETTIDFIKQHELYVGRVYDDKRPHIVLNAKTPIQGTLTAGWGHTGVYLVVGMTVTPAIAEAWLHADLSTAVERLYQVLNTDVIDALTDNQWGALISFAFNVGVDPKWSIWKVLNKRQFDQVPARINQFVNITTQTGGKVKCEGLVKRRAAEVVLWSTGEPGSAPANMSSGFTRANVTPPTPLDAVPVTQSKMLMTSLGSLAAAVPGVLSHIGKALTSPGVPEIALAVAAGAAFGAGCVAVWLIWRHKALSRG